MSEGTEVAETFLENTPVWVELEPQLDKLPLLELAKTYDVQAGQIAAALKRTGRKRQVRGEGEGALPPEPEEAAASKSGSKSHLVEEHKELLGKVPDAEVAQLANVSTRTVAAYRARNKIPGYDRWADPQRERKQRRGSRIDPFRDLVGVEPDAEVAKKAGVSPQAVRNYRSKNKIPAPKVKAAPAPAPAPPPTPAPEAPVAKAAAPEPTPPPAAPTPTAAPPPVAPTITAEGAWAWRVTFQSGERRIAASPDVSALIAAVTAAGHGPITAVERLDPML